MLQTIELHPLVNEDVWRAISYYQNISTALKESFIEDLTAAYNRIAATPYHYFVLNKKLEIRRCGLKQFPYQVVYQMKNDERILILSVSHLHQHSRAWKKRPY